jgi:biopolymer transport protein ExbD
MLPRADINVTPMMDVMLVVLMIFMVIVPAIDAAVDLPTATNADPRPAEEDEIVLQIDRSGTYVLQTPDVWGTTNGWNPETVMTPEELRRALGRLYAGRTRDRILYLKADTELPFGSVQRAIEIARGSGVRVVAAVTERRLRPSPVRPVP